MARFASVSAGLLVVVWGLGVSSSQALDCYSFSTGGYVCSDCAPTNNCGTCSGGMCDATLAQDCQVKVTAVPIAVGGYTKLIVPVPCSYKLDCIVPSPCSGACTVGTTPHSFSEEIGYNDMPNMPCPIKIVPV